GQMNLEDTVLKLAEPTYFFLALSTGSGSSFSSGYELKKDLDYTINRGVNFAEIPKARFGPWLSLSNVPPEARITFAPSAQPTKTGAATSGDISVIRTGDATPLSPTSTPTSSTKPTSTATDDGDAASSTVLPPAKYIPGDPNYDRSVNPIGTQLTGSHIGLYLVSAILGIGILAHALGTIRRFQYKRQYHLSALQRANLDSWRGCAPKLDSAGLDTNMKKNTGFIKKCKASMGQDSAAQLLREVNLLKLDKYVSEIVPATAEGLLRCKTSGDFLAAIDVVTALHARFPIQFTASLIRVLLKSLSPPVVATLAAMSPEQREREEQARLSRQKTLLRVVGEMYLSGLLWGIDSLPAGVDGLDRAAAFTLSHTAQSSSTGSSSSQGKFSAKVKDMVQQPGHCTMLGVLQNLFLSDKEHHLSIILATSYARIFRVEFALTEAEQLEDSACALDAIPPKEGAEEQVVGMES
ncbi:mRNA decay protein, partial [Coemansia sp. S85]